MNGRENEKKVKFSLLKLSTLSKRADKFFKVYQDEDIGIDITKFLGKEGREAVVESTQDDDVNSDRGVVQSGVQTCYRDLLVVKDYLHHHPDKVRRSLKTFKFWAPYFRGNMPTKVDPV